MSSADLIDRLRAWARRYEPRSAERTLFLQAAETLLALEAGIEAEVNRRLAGGLTVEAIEEALGGELLPWQRKRLEPPPPSSAA